MFLTAAVLTICLMMEYYADCPVLIDNLYKSVRKTTTSKCEDIVVEVIQNISDDVGKFRKGNEYKPLGGAIGTGEYADINTNESTVYRYLTILFPQMDKTEITDFQFDNRLAISTCYYNFIQWVANNYNELKIMITDRFKSFRKTPNNLNVHDRLKEIYLLLTTSHDLFLKGWELKDIQEWLGHADIETTGNIYTHISNQRKQVSARSLERTFVI